jgi:ADP-ribose pyrophosphatase YjhB (NUDIX family)
MNSRNHPLSYEEFKQIYSRVPRVSVDLVIQTPQGIVLTLRNLPSWNNLWHFPGSTVLYQESVEDAVKRTAREEAGISINIKKLLGYLEYPSEKEQRGFGSTISLLFLCELVEGILTPDDEASQIGTFSNIAKLPLNIVMEHRPIIEKILKGDELSL